MDTTALFTSVDDAVRQAESLYIDLCDRGLKDYNLHLRITVADSDEIANSDLCEIFVMLRVRGTRVVHAILNQGQGMGLPNTWDVQHADGDWGHNRDFFSCIIDRDVKAAVTAQVEIAAREGAPLSPYFWGGWHVKSPH